MKGAGGGPRRGWGEESPNRAAWKRSERGRRGRGGAISRAKTLEAAGKEEQNEGREQWVAN